MQPKLRRLLRQSSQPAPRGRMKMTEAFKAGSAADLTSLNVVAGLVVRNTGARPRVSAAQRGSQEVAMDV